ncbi:MAG: DUF1816 domain-containing protein [Cyanobacteria bacterium P01_F01_bin.3]
MQSSANQLHDAFSKSWWLEVSTQSPPCHYYFGPFESEHEVTLAQPGYESDLTQEGCDVMGSWVVYRQPPAELTLE